MEKDNTSANAFRAYEQAFKTEQDQHKRDLTIEVSEHRDAQVKTIIATKITDEMWNELINQARKASQHGEKQFLLLQFPSELCTDNARAINNPPNPTWPQTLQGEAIELYQRWDSTLRSHGFGLSAQVLNFPGGKPGDVGLFLRWGE